MVISGILGKLRERRHKRRAEATTAYEDVVTAVCGGASVPIERVDRVLEETGRSVDEFEADARAAGELRDVVTRITDNACGSDVEHFRERLRQLAPADLRNRVQSARRLALQAVAEIRSAESRIRPLVHSVYSLEGQVTDLERKARGSRDMGPAFELRLRREKLAATERTLLEAERSRALGWAELGQHSNLVRQWDDRPEELFAGR